MLFFAEPGDVGLALFWFILANIAFEMGAVFYNAYLPEIAPQSAIGRVSGYGWALGYVGGLLCMAVALFVFVWPDVPPVRPRPGDGRARPRDEPARGRVVRPLQHPDVPHPPRGAGRRPSEGRRLAAC